MVFLNKLYLSCLYHRVHSQGMPRGNSEMYYYNNYEWSVHVELVLASLMKLSIVFGYQYLSVIHYTNRWKMVNGERSLATFAC